MGIHVISTPGPTPFYILHQPRLTAIMLIFMINRPLLGASVVLSGRWRRRLVFLVLWFLVVAHAKSSLLILITANSDNAQAAKTISL